MVRMFNEKADLKTVREENAGTIDDVKNSFQSQSVLFNTFVDMIDESFQETAGFDQFLLDTNGFYWFTEKTAEGQSASSIYIFNSCGQLVKSLRVNGKAATLYEYDDCILAACEGVDSKGYIYKYAKEDQRLLEHWDISGFLWDLEKLGDVLYITSYLAETNEAVLYTISGQEVSCKVLGQGFFPTGVLIQDNLLYIPVCPLYSPNTGSVLCIDFCGNDVEEIPVSVSPRQIFSYDGQLILHGIDMSQGRAESIIYLDPATKKTESFQIPKAQDIRTQGEHLLIFNQETETIVYWSHAKKKITRIVQWPIKRKNNSKNNVLLNH
ncbi:hypothetical protein JOD45_000858 [Scopulibacillus daqui]|uniref:Uncharacterized protein n=1 Tax=Scopulibacillus daqui TaxID=1469162 RepID=A0ABS2PY76_9BACL|nr:hypothetical protein [Scopulibacillus daqui]MBM7644665.1 hypothetical protein [Scopulibacillus daqui]